MLTAVSPITVQSPLLPCVLNAARLFLPKDTPLLVGFDGESIDHLIPALSSDSKWPIIPTNINGRPGENGDRLRAVKARAALLWTDVNLGGNVQLLVRAVMQHSSWISRSRVIVTLKGTSDLNLVENILSIFWEGLADNVSIIKVDGENVSAYTGYPFGPGSCGTNISYVSKIAECKTTWNATLFPPKKYTNLHSCHFVISTFPFPPFIQARTDTPIDQEPIYRGGLELNALSVLGDKLNFTFELISRQKEKWGARGENGQWSGTLGDVQSGLALLTVGGFSASEERLWFFEDSRPYWRDALAWHVRPSPPPPAWKVLASAAPKDLLIPCVVAMFAVAATTRVIYSRLTTIASSLASIALLLEQPWPLPTETLRHRLLLGAGLLYAMHVNQAVRGALVAALSTAPSGSIVRTLEELSESSTQVEVATREDVFEALRNSLRGRDGTKRLAERIEFCGSLNECMGRFGDDPPSTHAIAASSSVMSYIIPLYLTDEYRRPTAFALEEVAQTTHVGMVLRAGHPLLLVFNPIISAIRDAGLCNYWLVEMIRIHDERYIPDLNETDLLPDENAAQPLGMNHLLATFYLLVGGLVAGFVVFLIECCVVFHDKCSCRDKRRGSKMVRPRHEPEH